MQPHPIRAPGDPERPAPSPTVDVVVPVFNEAAILTETIPRLHAYLRDRFPLPWRITIADNASTDRTLELATRLAADLPGVGTLHVDERGRGVAVRTAWLASDAPVVAYMDADLSTGLDALLPLVAPLVSGQVDVAVGSRLLASARVTRGAKRELISRAYNALLRFVFATRIHDAQCGFKAVTADAARRLLPQVRDDGWFFDTELLLLAERNGLRIHEIPVDWVDDTDSRVDVGRTALHDLRGVLRVACRFAIGRGDLTRGDSAADPARPSTGPPDPGA